MSQMFTKILAPIDFSVDSYAAMERAWELAKSAGAELHLLHVVPPQHLITLPGEQAAESARETILLEQAEEELTRIKRETLENSAKVMLAAIVGPPVQKITDYAGQQSIDLILLSRHGRTGLGHMIIGSVAEKLTRYAPCALMVLRPRR
jgi:universal stress protein A